MENILFIRLRLLGDIIFTLPAITLFHNKFPSTKIYYVVEEKFKDIVSILPHIYQPVIIPYKMRWGDIKAFRKRIKKLEIQTVIDFHSGPKSALLTRLSGIKTRIGYHTPNRNWAYNHRSPRFIPGPPLHSVVNQIRLLSHLGLDTDNPPSYPEIEMSDKQIPPEVNEKLPANNRVIIHVGAKNKFRDWGFDNFLNLIKKLNKNRIQPVLIGHGTDEKSRGILLEEKCQVVNLSGQLSIPETLAVISQSAAYFGADSGPLHLASLTQIPIVALYGPNIPEISGPWRKNNVTIIQQNLDCIPCSQKKCIYDTIACIKNIKVDEVYESIIRILK